MLTKAITNSDKKAFLTTLILIFNPLVYFLSFTFYSEMYLLALLVWAFFFFHKYLNESKPKIKLYHLMISAILFGSTILVRQQGIILSGFISLFLLVKNLNPQKITTKVIKLDTFQKNLKKASITLINQLKQKDFLIFTTINDHSLF